MSVTDQLLRLHEVDRQLRGLRSRISSADRYLKQQEHLLAELTRSREAFTAQIRQLKATLHNDEAEMAALDERVAKLRDQLNSAKTSKEYSAFLSEINTFKADKAQVEERALESMTRLEEINAAVADLDGELQERTGIRDVARAELERRKADAKERLGELERERNEACDGVPRDALAVFDAIAARISPDEDVMAPVDEQNRRSMEYSCGGCQTMLPVESVNRLLGKGELTRCVSCGAILYIEAALRESMLAGNKK